MSHQEPATIMTFPHHAIAAMKHSACEMWITALSSVIGIPLYPYTNSFLPYLFLILVSYWYWNIHKEITINKLNCHWKQYALVLNIWWTIYVFSTNYCALMQYKTNSIDYTISMLYVIHVNRWSKSFLLSVFDTCRLFYYDLRPLKMKRSHTALLHFWIVVWIVLLAFVFLVTLLLYSVL